VTNWSDVDDGLAVHVPAGLELGRKAGRLLNLLIDGLRPPG
jgi:hypothetical protein